MTTVDDAVAAAERIGEFPVVIKAQVHVGGRGKAGGVKLANDMDEVREHATNILGLDIKGHIVKVIWIEVASDIAEEYYASFTLDRSAKKHLGMLSAEGGVEIEAVAEENPDAIAKIWIDPVDGLDEPTARAWVEGRQPQPGGRGRRRRHPAEALPGLHRGRRRPLRDQPAHPQAHRRGARPRRQGHPGRQRRLPPRVGRVRGHPGPRRARAGRPREGPAVRRARRLGRHHRQRRRAGHEHARRRQPGRRQPRQLPRHRRRRQRRRHGRRARGHQQRPRREVDLHQHLRRHHPGRRGRQRHHRRPRPRQHRRPDRHPPRRHQRRRGPGDPRAAPVRPAADAAHDARRGPHGRRARRAR